MSKDRYERRHRRTARNINSILFMANANFDGPSLSEAMGLEEPTVPAATQTHTHTGYRREVGHVHSGRLYGHADYRGKSHALNGGANIYSGAAYQALCGKDVVADHDGYSFNVRPVGPDSVVGCKRCRAIMAKKGA